MKTKFEIQKTFPASTSELYNGWLDSEIHSKMTGGSANMSNVENEAFSAWDRYISGKNIKLVKGSEIIQTWRTSDFKEGDEDSELILRLEPSNKGTILTLTHSNIPEGQPDYARGWEDHYFTPMKAFFK
jgi:activator of HSP90 ATPase